MRFQADKLLHQLRILVLASLLLASSCYDPNRVTVLITIENKATEALMISNGYDSAFEMPKGVKWDVSVRPNVFITAVGKDTGTKHAERVFVVDGETWTIY